MTQKFRDGEGSGNYCALPCAGDQVYVMRLPGSQDVILRSVESDCMSKNYRIAFLTILLLSAGLASSVFGQPPQQTPASFKVVHVIGLQGVKHNSKGRVTVSRDALEFARGATKDELSIASIQDALTGTDSQRLIGGTLGDLTNFAPYGSGRFLSLFRTKIDTLTITYRDSGGGLHGAIFTLQEGQGTTLKKQLVAEGAKTSISVEDEANEQTNSKKAREKKP
jgi:hypothetical protein